jgi:hypothetical protein
MCQHLFISTCCRVLLQRLFEERRCIVLVLKVEPSGSLDKRRSGLGSSKQPGGKVQPEPSTCKSARSRR